MSWSRRTGECEEAEQGCWVAAYRTKDQDAASP